MMKKKFQNYFKNKFNGSWQRDFNWRNLKLNRLKRTKAKLEDSNEFWWKYRH